MAGGHVFVVHSDLTQLACDAWLLPCDAARRVAPAWFTHAPGKRGLARPTFEAAAPRVRRFDAWSDGAQVPQPWLVDVGGARGTTVSWYVEGLRAFLDAAAADLVETRALHGRDRPLLAVPLVGTGYGGARTISGQVVRAVLDALDDFVGGASVDVVLVLNEGPAFAAVQAERRRRGTAWPALDEALRTQADELASFARRHQLVLFLGAGTGAGAGLPMWDELLDELAEHTDLTGEDRAALRSKAFGPLDQARIVANRLRAGAGTIGTLIADHFKPFRHHSMVHALLAGLPVNEVATMNYDTLFEQASEAAGRPVRVLPNGRDRDADRWLLKMHGSVDAPDDIVLTRDDYVRYHATKQALAGIVQAMLMTRRMLFVGFSLTDDNFHRIASDVRQAVRGGDSNERGSFANALVLKQSGLLAELWKHDVACISMGPAEMAIAAGARQLEVFLDYLLAQSTSATAHLLDPTFEAVLTAEEREVRDALDRFRKGLSPEVRQSRVWDALGPMLAAFGAGGAAHSTEERSR